MAIGTDSLCAAGYTAEYRAEVELVLSGPHVTAMGAYYVGVVEGVTRNALGVMPHRELLQLAAGANSLEEAVTVAEQWIDAVHKTLWARAS